MDHIFSGNTVLDLDDDDDGEDSAHPLPIIIDRKRAPSGSKIPNPHRKRAATVSTRTTKAKNEAKPLTISTMFVWECTKTALGRKDPGKYVFYGSIGCGVSSLEIPNWIIVLPRYI